MLLSAGNGLLRLWDWRTGLLLRVLHEGVHAGRTGAIAIGALAGRGARFGEVVIAGGEGGELVIWLSNPEEPRREHQRVAPPLLARRQLRREDGRGVSLPWYRGPHGHLR